MAKSTPKLLEAFKSAAAQTVIDMETGERTRNESNILTKDQIYKAGGKSLYDDYTTARDNYLAAKKVCMKAKATLQKGFDTEFLKQGYITQSRHWDFELDQAGAMKIRPSNRDFLERYVNSVVREGKKQKADTTQLGFAAGDAASFEHDVQQFLAGNLPAPTPTPTPTPDEQPQEQQTQDASFPGIRGLGQTTQPAPGRQTASQRGPGRQQAK
jgi:hypothetical protein